MSGINVSSLESIEDFEGYLSGFLSEFSLECRSLRQSIFNNLADIENQLEDAQIELRAAQDHLHSQEEPSWEDQEAVERAEECYNEWAQYRAQFDEFAESAVRRIEEIESAQQRDVSQSVRFLSDVLDSAKKYLTIVPTSGHGSSFSGNSRTATSSGAASRAPGASGSSPLRSGSREDLPELPNGLSWVPIGELNWDEVGDDLEFDHHASENDITEMMQVFERDLVPELQSNQNIDVGDLTKRDRSDGRSEPTTGRAFAYEFMIGTGIHSDVVAVDAPHPSTGNRYAWKSGRHRALVAKRLGWNFIPARVVGGAL